MSPSGSAIFSPCGTYRYVLKRQIPSALRWLRPVLFCLLNPSTADATVPDNTLRRGMAFAKSWGATSLTFVNMYAFRATYPKDLIAAYRRGEDVVGPDNDRYVRQQLEEHRIGIIVAAWGAHQLAPLQMETQRLFAAAGAQCLGTTADGSPRHPLYLKADQPLVPWTATP